MWKISFLETNFSVDYLDLFIEIRFLMTKLLNYTRILQWSKNFWFFEEFWKNTFLNKIIRIQSENVKEGFFEKRDFCDLWKFSLCNLDFFKHKIFADFKNKSAIWQIIVLRRNSQNRNCFHAMFNAKFE